MLWCTHQYHHTKPPFRPMGKLEDLPPPIAPHCLLSPTYKPRSSGPLTERKGRGLSTSLEQQRILQWQLNGVRDFFCINSNLPMSSHRTLGRDNNNYERGRFDPSPFQEDPVNDRAILRSSSKDCSTSKGNGGLHC